MLTFEVASFNIRYNYILGRPSLLKFMTVIHTAYAIIKMPDPRGVITLKSDQRDALSCEIETLTHTGRFSEKGSQDARGRNPRQGSDTRPISRGHTQNACRKVEAEHDGYPCINPARH
jgi:hypothetical protein